MKIIKYNLCTIVDTGNPNEYQSEKKLIKKIIVCSEDNLENNIKIAENEAYNGEYTVEDEVEEQWQ